MTRTDESQPDRRHRRAWTLRIFFYAYMLVVAAAFIYPVHYMRVGAARVEVGRQFLLIAPEVYQPDVNRTIVEIMLAALVFLPVVILTARYGPERF
ncbi:MAG: hypothetical protein ACRD4D_05625 [Candidatus Acidiferrales bacterium]